MSEFKIGDKVEYIKKGSYIREGEIGFVAEASDEDGLLRVRFTDYGPYWVYTSEVKLVEDTHLDPPTEAQTEHYDLPSFKPTEEPQSDIELSLRIKINGFTNDLTIKEARSLKLALGSILE